MTVAELLRADVVAHVIAITDPLALPRERDAAYRWWDGEVFAWRDARGEVTDDERFEHWFLESMSAPLEQRNGCGQVVVNYQPPRYPGRRETR